RPRAHAPARDPARRGAALDAGGRGSGRVAARAGRRAPRARPPADARPPRSRVDGGAAREGGGALSIRVLRPLPPHGGRAAHGVPPRLADGGREGSPPPPSGAPRSGDGRG